MRGVEHAGRAGEGPARQPGRHLQTRLELPADRLLIDERLGRQAAAAREIRVVGTIGVLEPAPQERLIDLGQAFEAVKQTDFWISPSFLDERLSLFQKRTQHPAMPPSSAKRSGSGEEP
ncbi:DUF3368 domain-containing protein [Aquisphaera insulae]|uniref:DUF3368 domain-containing protein n=1 Tax=Aquisphaera insulae TaxID=2712864 RepID=UPI002110866A|nr:DUF3368 domain-containing protein [Aquisphaera insulae]